MWYWCSLAPISLCLLYLFIEFLFRGTLSGVPLVNYCVEFISAIIFKYFPLVLKVLSICCFVLFSVCCLRIVES